MAGRDDDVSAGHISDRVVSLESDIRVGHLPSFAVAWDPLDEDGDPYPITHDPILQLPPAEVTAMFKGLVEREMWRNQDLLP